MKCPMLYVEWYWLHDCACQGTFSGYGVKHSKNECVDAPFTAHTPARAQRNHLVLPAGGGIEPGYDRRRALEAAWDDVVFREAEAASAALDAERARHKTLRERLIAWWYA